MDWSIKQTVVSDNHTIIIFTDGSCTERTFGGTVIKNTKDPQTIGRHLDSILKWAYKPCIINAEIIKP